MSMISALKSLLRILFMRGSPERFLYQRRNFIIGLLLALTLSALAQHFYHHDHVVFVILRVFAETTGFMLWMVLLTAKVARLRLGNTMLTLVWASVLMDAVLLLLSVPFELLDVPPGGYQAVGLAWGLAISYGAVSVVGWALKSRGLSSKAALHVVAYVAGVTALDLTFRYLYGMIAGA